VSFLRLDLTTPPAFTNGFTVTKDWGSTQWSDGGGDTWDNVVTSCAACNRKKGDRLPHHVGLRLPRAPRPPEAAAFVYLHVDRVHDSWLPYLSFAS
jgi:5-methylcytosine-specific restriction endonuclease McrA